MKKGGVFLLVFLIAATSVFAASVSRNIPGRVDPGQQLTVNLVINNIQVSDTVTTFAIEEAVPEGFTITDWSVSGVEESKDQVKTQFVGNTYKWEFTPIGGSATVTYTTTAPATLGPYEFKATWFDLGGMSGAADGITTLTVRTVTCGDGVCEGTENSDNCLTDCPRPVTTTAAPVVTTTLPEEILEEVDYTWLWILIVVLVIILVVFLLIKKKKPKETELPKE